MRKLKKKWLSRALACALTVALTAGTAVMTPIADFVGTNTIASAATYTESVPVYQLKEGDILKAGAYIEGEGYWITVYDENNTMILNEEDHWSVYESDGKDYTINSITYDYWKDLYTIHVTSATSTSTSYTVTWMDGTTLLGTSSVAEGESPVYDGETTKTANGKEYVIAGWKDSDGNYYAKDSLPAVTGNVTYTAVYAALIETFEPFDTTTEGLTSYTGEHFQISCDNNGDSYGIWLNPNTAMVRSTDKTKITKLVATIGWFSPDRLSASAGTRTINGDVVTFTDINDTSVTLSGSNYVQVKHIDVYYMGEGYTVTWKDGTETLDETDVLTGQSPVYDGKTIKTANGKEYVLKGWKDNNGTYYANGTLPPVAGDVTYTAVYAVLIEVDEICESFDTNNSLTSYTGEHFKISCDNGGDDEDGIALVPGIYTAMVSSTDKKAKITKLVATIGWNSPDRLLASAGTRTINGDVVTFTDINDTSVKLYSSDEVQVEHIDVYYNKVEGYTVTWKDGTETLDETDVPTGQSPVYDGETTKAGENGIKYVISGWSDGTTTYGVNDTLPAVTDYVTYTASFKKLCTVTWLDNDGTNSLGTSSVAEGESPVYTGETTKDGENGIKYVLSGWNDGTTTYAPDALPAVTGNVTYTAVYTAYQNHDGILFAPWTSTNSLPTAAGNYYLTGNVTISGTWNAPDGINLCLNGYGIRYSGDNGSVIYLRSGYTLNIFDCDTTKEHYITLSNFRGTDVSDTGTETTVTDGTGVIKVNGGYITGGNNSGGGGGIDSDYYQSANVYIKGVTFIGNKANGAKNCGQGSAILLTIGSLSLDGTKFFYNYAQRDGGANAETVCRWSGTTSLKDVDMQYNVGGGINITGGNSAVVSGKTIICNNVYSTTNTKEFNASVTTLDGSELTDGSYIGIRNGDANSAPFTTNVATDYVQYFHMDPRFTNLVVSTDSDGRGIRKATYTVTWKNGEDIIETDEKVIEGDTPTYDGETPEKDSDEDYAYVFKGWTSDGGTTVYTAETLPAVTEDVTYTAVFKKLAIIHEDDIFVNSTDGNPEVIVIDCRTGSVLTADTDYTLDIADGTVTITGKGSYTGEVEKPFVQLSKALTIDVKRQKVGKNVKATLTGSWLVPSNATVIESGIARVHVSEEQAENITKEYVYENGIKKSTSIPLKNAKITYSLSMNQTAAAKNICAVTYVKYKIGDDIFTSISDITEKPQPTDLMLL